MIALVRWRELSNFVAISSTGAAPYVDEIYNSRFSVFSGLLSSSSSCFVISPRDHISQRILTYDGSKDVVWCEDVPFGCPNGQNQLLWVQNLSKLLQWVNPSQNEDVRKCWITCNHAEYTNKCNESLVGNQVRSSWIDSLFFPETPSGGRNLHLVTLPKGIYC